MDDSMRNPNAWSRSRVIAPADYPGGECKEFDIDRVWLAIEAAPAYQRQAAADAMRRLFPERTR